MINMKDKLIEALHAINKQKNHRVFLGFDAFIDLITRPIEKGNSIGVEHYFEKSIDFGEYIVKKSGMNSSVELDLQSRKIGGNTPNVASALGTLGVKCDCLAPFGTKEIDEIFRPLQQFGHLFSTGDPGLSLALEFENGKIMMALNQDVNHQNWMRIKETVQLNTLTMTIQKADMLCLLNWSEVPGATDIFRGLQTDVLPELSVEKPILIDLSDCSRRSRKDIFDILTILTQFAKTNKLILGLNENESHIVCDVMGIDDTQSDEKKAWELRKKLSFHWVVFHNRIRSILADEQKTYQFQTLMNGKPVLQTGAGDHFNAGLCLGYLYEMEPQICLALAAMTSGFYVEKGKSASLDELIQYIESMEEL